MVKAIHTSQEQLATKSDMVAIQEKQKNVNELSVQMNMAKFKETLEKIEGEHIYCGHQV